MGYFNEDLHGCEDMDHLLRVAEWFPAIPRINTWNFIYRRHDRQLSAEMEASGKTKFHACGKKEALYALRREVPAPEIMVECWGLVVRSPSNAAPKPMFDVSGLVVRGSSDATPNLFVDKLGFAVRASSNAAPKLMVDVLGVVVRA